MKKDLSKYRKCIDDCDKIIVETLNRRAKAVQEIGKLKFQNNKSDLYVPHREQEVLERVKKHSSGIVPDYSLEKIYKEIMSSSFLIEGSLNIGYLGPEGTYSHMAAIAHFGSSVDFVAHYKIEEIFKSILKGYINYGIVPIENSICGGISESLDSLKKYADKVYTYSESCIPISHNLLSNNDKFSTIFSKQEVYAQCYQWIQSRYKNIDFISVGSSAQAIKQAKEYNQAAIGSTLAADLYGINILHKHIEDTTDNMTRFVVLSKTEAGKAEHNKTSIVFTTSNQPGSLAKVLTILADNNVNLSHIDKRPSTKENWKYTFFIDVDGHKDDSSVKLSLQLMREYCEDLFVLGSYPLKKSVK